MTSLRPTEARGRRPQRPHLLRAIGLDLPLVRRAMRWIVLSASFLIVVGIAGTLYWHGGWWTFERVLAYEAEDPPRDDRWLVCSEFRDVDGDQVWVEFCEVEGPPLAPGWTLRDEAGEEIAGLEFTREHGACSSDGTIWLRLARGARARDFLKIGRDPAFVGRWEGWDFWGSPGPYDLRADGTALDANGALAFRWAGSGPVLYVYRPGWGFEGRHVRAYVRIQREPIEGAGTGWFECVESCHVSHLRPIGSEQ